MSEGDIEAHVEITVSGAGELDAAGESAEHLKSELEEAGAAGGEAGAEIASGADAGAAALAAEREEAAGLRDDLAEAAVAADAHAASTAGLTAAQKEAVAQATALRKAYADAARESEQGRTVSMPRDWDRYAGVDKEISGAREEAERSQQAIADIEKDLRGSKSSDAFRGSMLGGAGDIEKYAADLESANRAAEEAERSIDDMNRAVGDAADKAGIASGAMSEWHGAVRDFADGADSRQAIMAGDNLRESLDDFAPAAGGAALALEDLTGGGGGGPIDDLAESADEASKSGLGLGEAFGSLKSLAMPAMWASLAAAAATVGPAVLSAGAGFGAFGLLAAPALIKVKDGLSSVTQARQAYQMAKAVEKADPTSSNLKAEQLAAAQLKATYATMPPDIRRSVKAVEGLGTAFSQAAKKSGIEKDALKDIPKALGDIKGLIPDVEKLGQATAPIVSKMLGEFGKFEKSKGFSNFISNIKSEIPAVTPSLHKLGSAFGTLTSDLFSKSNMKIGNALLSSVAGVANVASGPAVHELGQLAKGITAVNNAIAKSAKPGGVLQQAGRYYDDFADGVSKTAHGVSKADSWAWHVNDNIWGGHLGKYGHYLGFSKDNSEGVPYNIKVKPHIEIPRGTKDLSARALGLGGKKSDLTAHVRISDTGAGKAKSDLQGVHSAAQKIGHEKADVKVRAEGAGQAESQLKHIKSAATQAGHVRADLHVSLTGASQASAQLQQLRTRAGGSWPQPRIQVALSGAQQAVSGLNQVRSAAASMASGVTAGASRARAAVTGMASGMRAAISPLPGAFRAVGDAAGEGMAAGIAASTGAAVAAAASMAHQVEAAARVELQTQSPSKKFMKIGLDVAKGFALGLLGGRAQVNAAIKALTGKLPYDDGAISSAVEGIRKEIDKAYKGYWEPDKHKGKKGHLTPAGSGGAGDDYKWEHYGHRHGHKDEHRVRGISRSEKRTLTRWLDEDNKKLQKLAEQRQALVSKINAADHLAASVASSARSFASIGGIAGQTLAAREMKEEAEGGQPGSSSNPFTSIQQGQKYRLGQINKFNGLIRKLKKEGLDEGAIKQVLGKGVTGGTALAEQILGEGPKAVRQISALDKQIAAASKQLGTTGANAAYESGSQIGKGLAAGLKSQLKAVNSEMASIAKTLITALMSAMGDSEKQIRAAIRKLDKQLGLGGSGGGGSGGGGGGSGSGGGGGKGGHGHLKPPHIGDPVRHYHPGPVRINPGEPLRAPHYIMPGPVKTIQPVGALHPGPVGFQPGGPEHITINLTSNLLVDGKKMASSNQTHTLRRARRNTGSGLQLTGHGT